MSNTIEINGCKLKQKAISFIRSAQDEDNIGLKQMEESLALLLVSIIQDNFDEANRNKFLLTLADTIELVHALES